MQFTTILSIVFAGLVAANASADHPLAELVAREAEANMLETRQVGACAAGLYSNPLCCATNVLGVASLDCVYASGSPRTNAKHKAVCANVGKAANCCFLPVAGQGVLCLPVHN